MDATTATTESVNEHEQAVPSNSACDLPRTEVLRDQGLVHTVVQTILRVALIVTDPLGVITFFSRGAEVLTGYTAGEVLGRSTPLLFHAPAEVSARVMGNDAAEDYSVYTRDASYDAIDELECTYRRKDGVEIAVYLAIQPLHSSHHGSDDNAAHLSTVRLVPGYTASDHGRPIRWFGGPTFKDRKTGIVEFSREWNILYRDKRALSILADLDLGQNMWQKYPSLIGTHVEEHLRAAMDERRNTNYENYYAPLDIWFRVHAMPSVAGIKLYFEDITQAKKLSDQLDRETVLREKRIEAISHMAGGLAHEISNPLAIIHMMAEDLDGFASGKEVVDAQEVKSTCELILETANRAMAILRGLKGFTREASNDPMAHASIAKIIDDCLQLQRSRFERDRVELRAEVAADLPLVLCREFQIGQIVNNLLNNAFDAVMAQVVSARMVSGWVCIHASRAGDAVRIEVTDSGPGVSEEAKPNLMEPFFTTKEIGGGTGIGLSLSRAIAEDHGGTLVLVEHAGPTCFRLTLPLQEAVKMEASVADRTERSV